MSTAAANSDLYMEMSGAAAKLVALGRYDLLQLPLIDIIKSLSVCSAGDGFYSVRWFGSSYTFTPTQARIVEKLWIAWKAGTPDLHQSRLLEDSESTAEHLKDVFKGHPAWNAMIVSTAKGVYRLQEPN